MKEFKADRLRKFYVDVMEEINKYGKTEEDKYIMIQRLNHYMSKRATLPEIKLVMKGIVKQQAQTGNSLLGLGFQSSDISTSSRIRNT